MNSVHLYLYSRIPLPHLLTPVAFCITVYLLTMAQVHTEAQILSSYIILINSNWTQPERDILIGEVFPSFAAVARLVATNSDVEALASNLNSLNRRTPAANRVKIGIIQGRQLVEMALFVADRLRIDRRPVIYDHAAQAAANLPAGAPYMIGWHVFTLDRGAKARTFHEERKTGKDPDIEAFPKVPADRNANFQEYRNQTRDALRNVYGTNGVPLAYLVRDIQEDPDTLMADQHNPFFDFIDVTIRCCPPVHPTLNLDERKLYKILYPRIADTPALSLAPPKHEVTQVGSALYNNIWRHLIEQHTGRTTGSEIDAQITKLHYKSERTYSFAKFITNLNLCWLRKASIGEERDAEEKIRVLLDKTRPAPALNALVVNIDLKGKQEKRTEAQYLEFIQAMQAAVARTGETPNNSNRRNVSNASSVKDRNRNNKGDRKQSPHKKDNSTKSTKHSHKLSEWVGQDVNVPNNIWSSWSGAERKQFLEARRAKRKSQYTPRNDRNRNTSSTGTAAAPAPAPAPPSAAELPPIPPPADPATSLQMGRTAAAAARSVRFTENADGSWRLA